MPAFDVYTRAGRKWLWLPDHPQSSKDFVATVEIIFSLDGEHKFGRTVVVSPRAQFQSHHEIYRGELPSLQLSETGQ